MKIKFTFIFVSLLLFIQEIAAQKVWKTLESTHTSFQKKDVYERVNFPSEYKIASLNINNLKTKLTSDLRRVEQIIELPNKDGKLLKYRFKETSNFEANLSIKFPGIKSYSAQGIDDSTASAKISIGTDGFHAIIYSGNENTLYIEPYSKDNKNYIIYRRKSLNNDKKKFSCKVTGFSSKTVNTNNFNRTANDGKLRTFRLALACSAEYAQFHLNNQSISASATDAVKKTAVLSAMNTSLTRINGIFERDLSLKMILVANNEDLVFLNAATDNITEGVPSLMIKEIQTICDATIGDANYDIGHLFSVGGDGSAGRSVVCVPGQKAKGVTGRNMPIGDAYDIDYVAHEIGHQFGANHTQNNSCQRNLSTAVEPGSGSTIMGYAGICSPNVQSNSNDYFHAVSISEMWGVIQSSASCATLSSTGNSAPTANAGSNYSIPKSTPFVLTGSATDVDGVANLTYNWEQIDNQIAIMSPLSTSTAGPVFRSFSSTVSPKRYMPDLATIVSGNTQTTWEVLPSVARNLNFSFLVRDNNAGGGSTARDDMRVEVTNVDPFVVYVPNTAVTWDVGSTQTITWGKEATDVAPINCHNVTIKLSIDGGITFPITLKANTPNDGTENIVVPNNITTSARIMVAAADNIFYNVNTTPFTIECVNTASIEDFVFDQFNLYPNPSNGTFNLKFEVINSDNVFVELFDLRGRSIYVKSFVNTKTIFSKEIVFDKNMSGLYLLKITNGGKQTTRKIVFE